MNAPPWVRCPSCGERARAAKVKHEGSMAPVQLRNGAMLYECSNPSSRCGLRLGIFSIYTDADGGVVYDVKADLERVMDAFNRHARVVEDCIEGVRGDPLASRNQLTVLASALDRLREAVDDVAGAVP